MHFRHEDADRHTHAERDHPPRSEELPQLQDIPTQLWIDPCNWQVLRGPGPAQVGVARGEAEDRLLPPQGVADEGPGAAQQVHQPRYRKPMLRLVHDTPGGDGPQRPEVLLPAVRERPHQDRGHHSHEQPQEQEVIRWKLRECNKIRKKS